MMEARRPRSAGFLAEVEIMKMNNTNLACLAVVIGGILAVPVASAAEPVDITSNITIDSVHCTLSVLPGSTAVAMNYKVEKANVDAGTPGTYTVGGEGTADYTISTGNGACPFGLLDIQMPVVGKPSGVLAVALYKGDTKFLINTFVSDLYATANVDGSGTPTEIVGAGINTIAGTVQRTFARDPSGYVEALTLYKPTNFSDVSTETSGSQYEAIFSAPGRIKVTNTYFDGSSKGWPSGYSNSYVNGVLIPTGYLQGATGGAHVVIPAGSLTGQQSVTIKVGTAASALPYTQQVADVGGVVNGEVFSGTGTLTVTSS